MRTPKVALMSQVLNRQVLTRDIRVVANELWYWYDAGGYNQEAYIPAGNFITKCKDWAASKDKLITTQQLKDSSLAILNLEFTFDLSNTNKTGKITHWEGCVRADTEFDAVTIMCEEFL